MIRFSNIPLVSKKTVILMSAAALGAISLVSCKESKTPVVIVESSPSTQQTAQTESPTLQNLQKAYNGESNAHVMYLAFAQKADEEGYKGVASLFRAAAAAEAIHRDNHAKVIQAMGATPQSTIVQPDVKSTSENLQQSINGGATVEGLKKAIKGESYERDTMYPGFIEQAKAEGNQTAVQTFSYALAAETQHAQLYTQAKNNLEKWRNQTHSFNVCNVSGETTMVEDGTPKCPTDGSRSGFEKVS